MAITQSRESRLLLMIEATCLGRISAATNQPWASNKYPVGSDAWCWWCEGWERERLRQELERVHEEADEEAAVRQALADGRIGAFEEGEDAKEPQRSVWASFVDWVMRKLLGGVKR